MSTPHGTLGGYTNHRCRCELCRAAWAEYHLRYMNEHPEQRAKHREKQRQRRASITTNTRSGDGIVRGGSGVLATPRPVTASPYETGASDGR